MPFNTAGNGSADDGVLTRYYPFSVPAAKPSGTQDSGTPAAKPSGGSDDPHDPGNDVSTAPSTGFVQAVLLDDKKKKPQGDPRWLQDNPKTAPTRPKMAPRRPQESPKMAPSRLQDGRRWLQDGKTEAC